MADGDGSVARGGRAADEAVMVAWKLGRWKGAADELMARTKERRWSRAAERWPRLAELAEGQWKVGRRGRGEAVERRG